MTHLSKLNRTQANPKDSKAGFTLIELSIVLVIIGLIVGGVLVGQDLIAAAQMRATVSQLNSYNAAVNTFRNKYSGLPGDLANGSHFFAALTNDTDTVGCSDGNGLIEATSGDCATVVTNGFAGETTIFWYEMAQAQLIPDNINDPAMISFKADTLTPHAGPGTASNLPLAKLGGSVFWTVGSNNQTRLNYFVLSNVGTTASVAAVPVNYSAASNGGNYGALTPSQAYDIDSKLDDGNPLSGIVTSLDPTVANSATTGLGFGGNGTAAGTAAASNDTVCYDGKVAGSEFYASSVHPKQAYCAVAIRASF